MNNIEKLMHRFLAEKGDGIDEDALPIWKGALYAFVEFCKEEEVAKFPVSYIKNAYNNCHLDDGVCRYGNKYRVYVQIQDGVEHCGEYDSKEEAQQCWADSQKILNGNNYQPLDAPYQEYQPSSWPLSRNS